MIYLSTTVIFVSVKFPWKFFQEKSWNVLKIRKRYFIDSIKMLHAKYHWLKQFEMNDKHQVQLYSFGMSTGITTLLGLFYTLDKGSTNNSLWLTTMSDDFWSFIYVRRTLIQRTIMLEKVERAFWESTISMNLCFQYFKGLYHFNLWWN